eukprot:791471-Prorocentrum_minimum.AAC.2
MSRFIRDVFVDEAAVPATDGMWTCGAPAYGGAHVSNIVRRRELNSRRVSGGETLTTGVLLARLVWGVGHTRRGGCRFCRCDRKGAGQSNALVGWVMRGLLGWIITIMGVVSACDGNTDRHGYRLFPLCCSCRIRNC